MSKMSETSVGAWTPESAAAAALDQALIERLLSLSPETAEQAFTADEAARYVNLHEQTATAWQAVCQELSDVQLVTLMQVLTVLEERLPGWEAGADSSVIKLNRLYRQRGNKLDREVLLWMRSNSSNRFIPNGPL